MSVPHRAGPLKVFVVWYVVQIKQGFLTNVFRVYDSKHKELVSSFCLGKNMPFIKNYFT